MAHRRLLSIALAMMALALAVIGCSDSSGEESGEEESPVRTTLVAGAKSEPKVPLPKGDPPTKLVVEDLREGYGQEARKGDLLVTELVAEFVTGERFESSWDPGSRAFIFNLGKEEANPGWEKGIPGMKVGGRRLLIVPPDEGSRFGTIRDGKPEDTLVYVVELVAILPPELEKREEPDLVPPAEPPAAELEVRDIIKGTGPEARDGDVLTLQYVGIYADGRPFTNSWKRKEQFDFELGAEELMVNPGWEKGLQGMAVGGRRELIVPPDLQTRGETGEDSKPSDTLIYVIDLLGITEPRPQGGNAAADAET
ncbi:MAG TPA: FKBP-type peptidyl-prolyl cis-trans isomerase [Solirubrobacterales bacterium]